MNSRSSTYFSYQSVKTQNFFKMKLNEVLRLIRNYQGCVNRLIPKQPLPSEDMVTFFSRTKKKDKGYMITCEVKEPGVLRSVTFPNRRNGESIITEIKDAERIAKAFATCLQGRVFNVYVVGYNYVPASGNKYNPYNPYESN